MIEKFQGIRKKILITGILICCILSINTIITATPEYGLANKIDLIKDVMLIVKNDSFEIKEEGLCHTSGGWRYLFKKFGRLPERSPSDRSVGYLFPEEISKKTAKFLIIISEKRIPMKTNTSVTKVIERGGFKAYLYQKP
jgi:hypothetical protein